jgi:hypothetical protein
MIKFTKSTWLEGVERVGENVIVHYKDESKQPETFVNVSDGKFEAWLSYESKGTFFNYAIRDNPLHKPKLAKAG